MDQTMENIKLMGFSGIISHSFKTIFTYKKPFALTTLTLILPLTLTFISHMHISNHFFTHIEHNPFQLFTAAFDNYRSYYNPNITPYDLRAYFLFKFITFFIIFILSLLLTASVVYAVASDHTGGEVSYRNSLKVVPKVWKRLTVTLLCMFVSLFGYSLLVSVAIFVCHSVIGYAFGNLFMLLYVLVYVYGFLYLSIVWQLGCVVSVLESSYGIRGMVRAMDLMNGKKKSAITVSYLVYLCLACVAFVYMAFVVYDNVGTRIVWRVVFGIVCGIMFVMIFLLVVVSETVLYLVCKLHHGETIDRVSLSTYLSSYLSDPRPVFRTGEDIQLGRPHNQLVSQV